MVISPFRLSFIGQWPELSAAVKKLSIERPPVLGTIETNDS